MPVTWIEQVTYRLQGAAQVSGSITFDRAYFSPPLVLASIKRNDGAILYPFAYTYGAKVSTSAWSVINRYFKLEVTGTGLQYFLCSQGEPYRGTLKAWVIGW